MLLKTEVYVRLKYFLLKKRMSAVQWRKLKGVKYFQKMKTNFYFFGI